MLALWLGAMGPQSAWCITGAQVVEKMRQSFGRYGTFSVSFEKQFYWAVLDQSSSLKGKIYTRRPDHFRLEAGDGNLVVADGETIWSYVAQNEQVIVSSYEGGLKTPWEILVDYTDRYETAAVEEVRLGKRNCYLLALRPRTENAYVTQMRIWVDRNRWHLLKVEQIEANDNITTYILEDHRTNRNLDDAIFRFEFPAGVEVIDRRNPEPP
jgi:chaperone LolA